jgi:lipopolysaccharide/colanic/teichoic acid biosynthesis glycosyltransferase
MKRIFDIVCSFIGLILLIPVGIIISICIKLNSKGPILYLQERIGKSSIPFILLKFRTMNIGADKKGQLTIGGKDSRITSAGYWLRKFKIDELPQLWNVFIGEMSLVGPRPEVRGYVELYTEKQKCVFSIRPGITDWASVKFRNENDLIVAAENPEEYYINQIMPVKLAMNLEYIEKMNPWIDLKIILLTIFPFLKSRTILKMESKSTIVGAADYHKTK